MKDQVLWNVLIEAMRFWKECCSSPQAMTTKQKRRRERKTGLACWKVCRTWKGKERIEMYYRKEEGKKRRYGHDVKGFYIQPAS